MIIILLLLLAIASVTSQDKQFCLTCIVLDHGCYNISYLFKLKAPFREPVVVSRMQLQHSQNLLFYVFEPHLDDEDFNRVAYVSLDNATDQGTIYDDNFMLNLNAIAIDEANSTVYLGGSDGIFTIDKNKTLTPFATYEKRITSLFYYKNVHYVKNLDDKIMINRNDIDEVLLQNHIVDDFLITNDGVLVFLKSNGLYLKNDQIMICVAQKPLFRGLAMDLDGQVFAWWLDEIYKVVIEKDLAKSRLVLMGQVPLHRSIGAMTFDNGNNILFSHDKCLYRLTRLYNVTCQ